MMYDVCSMDLLCHIESVRFPFASGSGAPEREGNERRGGGVGVWCGVRRPILDGQTDEA